MPRAVGPNIPANRSGGGLVSSAQDPGCHIGPGGGRGLGPCRIGSHSGPGSRIDAHAWRPHHRRHHRRHPSSGVHLVPYEVSIQTTYWGSRPQLVEVLDLAARELLRPKVTTFSLDTAMDVYRTMRPAGSKGEPWSYQPNPDASGILPQVAPTTTEPRPRSLRGRGCRRTRPLAQKPEAARTPPRDC